MYLLEVAGADMSGLATALQGILTNDSFMGALIPLIPVIGGVLIFAFVYGRVKKIVGGAQKGKARI